jgi:CBS domain containing-hemolysin-like protein
MNIGYIILLIATLLLSAFFSGCEIGFLSSNKFKIALGDRDGSHVDRMLQKFVEQNARFISTILIGNNLALVLYGLSSARILEPWLETQFGWQRGPDSFPILVSQTVISTLVVLLFAEYLPKAVYRANPDRLLRLSARGINVFFWLLRPAVALADRFSGFVLHRVFRLRQESAELAFSKNDLFRYMSDNLEHPSGGNALEIDPEVFKNAMAFNTTRVREFMVPRTELEALPVESSKEELIGKFIETELSRILLYEETLDNTKGYVHISAMFGAFEHLPDVLQPLLVVPENMAANTLLAEFHDNRRSVALVVDEFGGTAGLVTIEDLVEIILGDIEDEHDEDEAEELVAKKISETAWLFSARWEVEELNEAYGLELPEEDGDYTTLAGFVLHLAERIPAVGEHLTYGRYRMTVVSAERNRLESIRVDLLPEPDEAELD